VSLLIQFGLGGSQRPKALAGSVHGQNEWSDTCQEVRLSLASARRYRTHRPAI
jgi:hypothetical protein